MLECSCQHLSSSTKLAVILHLWLGVSHLCYSTLSRNWSLPLYWHRSSNNLCSLF
uniref:Uncharacterized protein n=1 Tax=Arundo donax TaxID=35708 RepID=A0A0A9ELV1_ARUDO